MYKLSPINKFVPCDWDNKIEKEKCQKCNKIPPEMFYRRTDRSNEGGDYWCKDCIEKWTDENDVTARLDEIAGELETVDPRLALAIDRVSDRLENKFSSDWARPTPDERGLRVEKKVNKNSIAYKRGLKDGNEKTGRPFLDGVDNYRYEVGSQEYTDYKAGHADAY